MKKAIWLMIFLLLMSGCSYQPSEEDIVDTHGDITNLEIFMEFIENVQEGKEDKIRVVRYTTEGDPILHDLEFDGEVITSKVDSTRDEFGSGKVSTAACQSIDVIETHERTEYSLTGCSKTNRDNSILIFWK